MIVSSYTHAEYQTSMAEVFETLGASALLLRGTEGEATADARRMPAMEGFRRGRREVLEERQPGALATPPEPAPAIDAESTAAYTQDVLAGRKAVPAAIAAQVEHILRLSAP